MMPISGGQSGCIYEQNDHETPPHESHADYNAPQWNTKG